MTYIQSIKFRSFSFYSSRSGAEFKRNFISGRSENIQAVPLATSTTNARYESWWRMPKYKKNYRASN